MQLGRYNVSTLRPTPINSIRFSIDNGRFFAVSSEGGYEIWRTYPLKLVKRRGLQGTLGLVVMLQASLLVLQGGGNNPLYPPNKAVIYSDKLPKAVAELEFSERIRGIVVRHSTIVVALSHRVAAFAYGTSRDTRAPDTGSAKLASAGSGKGAAVAAGFWVEKIGEWATAENETGLMAISTVPGSTLLALPGRQAGHVQLISLPPCPSLSPSPPSTTPPNTFRSPIILAHTHPLSSLTCTLDGSKIITTSERGTLLRVWDTTRGQLERELRRGVDRAVMWGATFVPPQPVTLSTSPESSKKGRVRLGDVAGWSDKGTIHVWSADHKSVGPSNPAPTLSHMISRTIPLPKYFTSPASFAQYHLPRKNPHAFASVVSAAADKAGVRGKGLDIEESDEWAERFVVSWVWVGEPKSGNPGPASRTTSGETAMGTREERRSGGSEMTSRTVTPTFRARQGREGGERSRDGRETPTTRRERDTLSRRQSSLSSNDTAGNRGRSGSSTSARLLPKSSLPDVPQQSAGSGQAGHAGATDDQGHYELVAITFSGDWYRLRLPVEVEEDDKTRERKGKCELVEYRRLGVGGGGW